MNDDAPFQVLHEEDCPRWTGGRIVIYGYGNQGRAQALCLRDGGLPVVVALRPGSPSREPAAADGLTVIEPVEAAKAELLVWAVPDEAMTDAAKGLGTVRAGSSWLFLHGLAPRWGWIEPPETVDILLLAPQGPGAALRSAYASGAGLPAAIAVEHDASGKAHQRLLAYARAIGCARGGLFRTDLAEETVVDHFGEQAVLCGGVPALVRAAWETLVAAGYGPETAYIECLMQLKLLVDLMYKRGVEGMRRAVSPTALFGAREYGAAVIGPETRGRLTDLLKTLESGEFAASWRATSKAGWNDGELTTERDDTFEAAGRRVRRCLRWPGLERSAVEKGRGAG
ncbi:MAG: ketol-acid reductoisomerase [Candidatus Coatesbacteria bacterium]|nr:ketol-acid reductoisomerase [Candidatus Coatesbacteria bacterium]